MMYDNVISELAPSGIMRAGINMANIFLVTGKDDSGDPEGVSPSIARAIADELSVKICYVPYLTPGETADSIKNQECDIVMIADEPARAESISFTDAYVEIEATYLVDGESNIKTVDDVDQVGSRIAVSSTSAYDLYLTRNLKYAELHRADGLDAAARLFETKKLDALAGLRPALLENLKELPHNNILGGNYMTVKQSIGTHHNNTASHVFLREFVAEAKASGLILRLIQEYQVEGKIVVAE